MAKKLTTQQIHDYLIESIQEYWMISIIPHKHIRPSRTYDISAGNIRDITKDYVSIKYYRFLIWPSRIKIKFGDIRSIRRFFKRSKPLSSMDVTNLSDKNHNISKRQARIASVMKYSALMSILLIVAGLSVGLAFAMKAF